MRRVAAALIFALLAVPVAAQVEIRGLTIAAPDKPGNGGIMLKSVISTRLPGEISELWRVNNDVFVKISEQTHRLLIRNGQLVQEISTETKPKELEMVFADLDGDGTREAVRVEENGRGSQLIVSSWGKGSVDQVATLASEQVMYFLGFTGMMRSNTAQIIYTQAPDYCLRLLALQDKKLTDVGSLSCGAPLVALPVIADIDGDGRGDLIAARQHGRIEFFLR
jgi:hypothetical protein